jgi:hypothetical protein
MMIVSPLPMGTSLMQHMTARKVLGSRCENSIDLERHVPMRSSASASLGTVSIDAKSTSALGSKVSDETPARRGSVAKI